MYSLYDFLFENHRVLNFLLFFLLIFSMWIVLNVKQKRMFCSLFKWHYKENLLINQLILLISIIAINIFTCGSLGDYWHDTIILSILVCFIQVIGLVLLFVKSKENDEHIKRTSGIGVICLILEFTNIYCFIYIYSERFIEHVFNTSGVPFIGVNGLSPYSEWADFFFYSISLFLPFELTEIHPITILPKVVSLIQIGIFYLLVFNKLSDVYERNKKELNKIGTKETVYEGEYDKQLSVYRYSVTVEANSKERGNVSFTGTPIKGRNITLAAIPNEGYTFMKWKPRSEDIAINDNNEFIMPEHDVTVIAIFALENEPEFKVQSLKSKSEICVNFFMDLSMLTADQRKESYVTFRIGNSSIEKRVNYNATFRNKTGLYYGFPCHIDIVQIADTITATYHYKVDKIMYEVEKQYSLMQHIKKSKILSDPSFALQNN